MVSDTQTAVQSVRTVCSYCGVGCGLVLDVAIDDAGRRRVIRSTGDKAHPANAGRLCTKGSTTADMLAAPGRLTQALVRPHRGDPLAPQGMEQTLSHVGRELRRILDQHGPDALAFYVSGQMTIEAQYLITKLAKGFVRTNQIESNSRLCMASAASGYKLSLGADGPPGSYDDLDHADVFFVIGANMADCHPILFLRMMDRVKTGARLIVVDPRRTATADKADLFLQIKPGTDLALLNGLLHLLVADGHIDRDFIDQHTDGWELMPELLREYAPSRVAHITGLAEADLRTAARWIGEAGNWMSLWTMGLNQSTHGTWNTNALCNLHLATGAICRPGSGPFSLTGQPNAMGGREMGYMGPGLPGQRSVLVDADRAFVEQLWDIEPGTLRTEVGRGTVELFTKMAAGEIKACWVICTNPVASVANRRTVIDGLEARRAGHHPGCLRRHRDQRVRRRRAAGGDVGRVRRGDGQLRAQPDLAATRRPIRRARRCPTGRSSPELLVRWASRTGSPTRAPRRCSRRSAAPPTRSRATTCAVCRTQCLPSSRCSGPSAPDGPARNPIRYLNDGVSQQLTVRADGTVPRLAFPTSSGRARFFPRPHAPAAEMPDEAFPFVLNTGRVQHQWHTLTKTGKVAKLNKLNPGPFIELHPEDAAALDIHDGDTVEVASRRGRAVLPAVVTDRVLPGCCFTTVPLERLVR